MNYDYLINLIFVINIVLTISANLPLAGQTFKHKLAPVSYKPKTFLQNTPKYVSAIIFIMIILGLFGIGKIKLNNSSINLIRLISTIFYVVFTWIQIYAAKQLKQFYTQDIIVFKDQEIFQNGWYGLVRHPIYLSQIFQDLFAGIALLNYLILIITLFIEIPLYIMRANLEEEILSKNFPYYNDYKKLVGKWFPKIFNLNFKKNI